MKIPFYVPELNRRDFLYGLTSSLGALAMTDLMAKDSSSSTGAKKPMHEPKAKNVIMLFMEGGPSQVDTFDPKPKLNALHKSESKRTGTLEQGYKFFVGSPYGSRKVGQSGLDMSDQWVHLPEVADDVCNYRGCFAESLNHPEALFHMNTGSRLGGDPSLGAWANYGLGSVNQNLPGYVVMTELALPQGGSRNWSNGFLPGQYQGTRLRLPVRRSSTNGLPTRPPTPKTSPRRTGLAQQAPWPSAPNTMNSSPACKASSPTACKWKFQVIDLEGETEKTKEAYGLTRDGRIRQTMPHGPPAGGEISFRADFLRGIGRSRLPRACPCSPYQERGPTMTALIKVEKPWHAQGSLVL